MVKIEINSKGNGDYLNCKRKGKCTITESVTDILIKKFINRKDEVFELVIYACPNFEE